MTLTLHEHPFASYCWKALIALYERDVPFARRQIDDEADRASLAELWPMASMPVLVDGHVQTPMQKIVGDNLRPNGAGDPRGVEEAREKLDRIYPVLDTQLGDNEWLAGVDFSLADCAAAPGLFYARAVRGWDEDRLTDLTRYYEALTTRPSVARVIDEARPFRPLFPLPWPDYVD